MKVIRYIALSLFAACSLGVAAQTAKSSYFLEGAFHNSQLNPAMAGERSFVSFPLLGNLMVGANSNVGLSNFLFPQPNGRLATFMSGNVTPDQFLNAMPSTARMGMDMDMTLAALGIRAFGGYTTFNVVFHGQTSIGIPKDIFKFAKTGFKTEPYSFSGINMNLMSYMAVTLGHSREIIDGLRVGVNLKYLMGLAYADVLMDKFTLETSEERWMVEAHAQARLATFMEMKLAEGDEFDMENMEMTSFTPSASGFAVDLGATYDMKNLVPGLKLSASVTDVGYIKWSMIKGNTESVKLEYTGLEEIDMENVGEQVEEQLDEIMSSAEEMLEFQVDDMQEEKTWLGATMYLGAEYEMPFYQSLSVGLLYGQRFSKYTGWNDVRGYLNISPLGWLEASTNVSFSTFGTSLGWMFNFHPAGFSFFVGSDYMVTKVNPQFIPINEMNTNITLGVNIPLGKKVK